MLTADENIIPLTFPFSLFVIENPLYWIHRDLIAELANCSQYCRASSWFIFCTEMHFAVSILLYVKWLRSVMVFLRRALFSSMKV